MSPRSCEPLGLADKDNGVGEDEDAALVSNTGDVCLGDFGLSIPWLGRRFSTESGDLLAASPVRAGDDPGPTAPVAGVEGAAGGRLPSPCTDK